MERTILPDSAQRKLGIVEADDVTIGCPNPVDIDLLKRLLAANEADRRVELQRGSRRQPVGSGNVERVRCLSCPLQFYVGAARSLIGANIDRASLAPRLPGYRGGIGGISAWF